MTELTTKRAYMGTTKVTSFDIAPKPHDGPRLGKDPEPRIPDRVNARISEPLLLFSASEMADFGSRWISLEKGFVDDPRRTLDDADKLVAWVMQRHAHGLSSERLRLKKQWELGGSGSTMDLRSLLQSYRSFFDRLTENVTTATLNAPSGGGLSNEKEHSRADCKITE
jgi:hypothetical protein